MDTGDYYLRYEKERYVKTLARVIILTVIAFWIDILIAGMRNRRQEARGEKGKDDRHT